MSSQTSNPMNQRRSANYQPNIWDDDHIQSIRSNFNEELRRDRLEQLKQEANQLLKETNEPLAWLNLIDSLQRLGISYHFEEQIEDELDRFYSDSMALAREFDLCTTALCFRLLRQHGHNVSPGIFSKFVDKEGAFKASLCEDVRGLLSLYEASYLGIKGEGILEEAKAFATKNLKTLIRYVEPSVAKRIGHALELPLHWRMVRLEARHFINVYEEEQGDDDLLELAKLDFNMVQSLHQREMRELSRWWELLGLGEKLGFVRDRLMESFLWTVGVIFEPEFSECRKMLTKLITFIVTIDDIYDVYGLPDELHLFTDAVDGWDLRYLQLLPEYMKLCYLALYNTTNEFAYMTLKKQGWNVVDYLKKSWAVQCKAFHVEAQWYSKGYTPTLEEYLSNASVSIGGPLAFSHMYTFMQPHITREDLLSVNADLNLVRWSSTIIRLCDDLETSKAEMQRGDVTKSVECYMHETGVPEELAREHMRDLIDDIWKKINEECLVPSTLPKPFVNSALNTARMAQCAYLHGDGYGVSDRETKEQIMSLFLQSVPLNKGLIK